MDPTQVPPVANGITQGSPLQNPAAMNPYAALMYRKAQLQAQEQAAMQASQGTVTGAGLPPPPPAGQQAAFSGYGMQRPQMTPQQMQQLAILLQRR